jgi:hypothetical protein
MAAILLIVVSVAWILVSRMIVHELKKAAYRAAKRSGKPPPPPRRRNDVWDNPP